MKKLNLCLLIKVLHFRVARRSSQIASSLKHPQASDDEDAEEFFKELESAQDEIFRWIRDEYRMPTRRQRDVDAVNGDTWYKNYQIKECQTSNKSSLCNGYHVKHEQQLEMEKHAPEISDLFDELDKPATTWMEKLPSPTHGDERINDGNMKAEHLPDHRGPNDALHVEARLNAKQFLAKQQNAVHEIEMKHRHLPVGDTLNGNQLRVASSNNNFPSTFALHASSTDDMGQQQKPPRLDDQLEQKRNDLLDEVDVKLSGKEQESRTLHRVKRRDAGMNVINRLMTSGKFDVEEFLKSLENSDGDKNN